MVANIDLEKAMMSKEEKDMSGHYDELAAAIKPAYSNLNEPIYADNVKYAKAKIKEDKDMDKLVKAIKADHEWANETSIIFENELPDIFQSPEQKAFLNGVKFATRKYMEIIQEMEESND